MTTCDCQRNRKVLESSRSGKLPTTNSRCNRSLRSLRSLRSRSLCRSLCSRRNLCSRGHFGGVLASRAADHGQVAVYLSCSRAHPGNQPEQHLAQTNRQARRGLMIGL